MKIIVLSGWQPDWGKSKVLMIETDEVSLSLRHVIYENASSPQTCRDRVCSLLGNLPHLLALLLCCSWLGGCRQLPLCLQACGSSWRLLCALLSVTQEEDRVCVWGLPPVATESTQGPSTFHVTASVILPSTAKILWVFGDWVGRWSDRQLCVKLIPRPDTGFLCLGRTWKAPHPLSPGLLVSSGKVLLCRCARIWGNT